MASNSYTAKVLLTLRGDEVATRFDLCGEVLIAQVGGALSHVETRTMLLSGPSADEICGIAIKENVSVVVTGGIEEEHFQYLQWKKIKIIDRVAGNIQDVLRLIAGGELRQGMIVKTASEADNPDED